ncbi:hypothetical protein ACLEPN_19305 [Myxococcus sp. 1LA]
MDHGTGTVRGAGWLGLLDAFNKALAAVRAVADAGRESQPQDTAPRRSARITGGAR